MAFDGNRENLCANLKDCPPIFYEASHTAQTNARTGIQSVVRGLAAGLLSQGVPLVPVRWSFKKNGLTPLRKSWERNLGLPGDRPLWLPAFTLLRPRDWLVWKEARGLNYKTPIHRHPSHRETLSAGWLLLPELMEGGHLRLVTEYARQNRLRLAGIFHDAIAWFHPEVVAHWTQEQHRNSMTALAALDVVIPVSDHAGKDFLSFLHSQNCPVPRMKVSRLPAEVLGWPRETQAAPTAPCVRILCVSTLEPRKNHLRLLEAFTLAQRRLNSLAMELHLVGGTVPDAPEIAEAVRAMTRDNPAVIWHGEVDAAALRTLYRDCSFTVFGSWIEGFGLPVLESLWFGKPCLCSDQGPMAENAAGGGCLPVETRSVEALAGGLQRLAEDPVLRGNLAAQACGRPLKTWAAYAGEILQILRVTQSGDPASQAAPEPGPRNSAGSSL